jgi:hypothetical protein
MRDDQIDVSSMRLPFARTINANIMPARGRPRSPLDGNGAQFPMKNIVLLASTLVASHAAAADLGTADLPRIHAEYKANQARWAREFLDKTFAATMTLDSVSNVFGNDSFMVTFLESPSDWLPGVACNEAAASDFLISKNKGDSIFVRGVVKDHSLGSLDLRDCEFFVSEQAASEADAKRLADEANGAKQAATASEAQAIRQADDAEAKRLAIENAAIDESTREAAATSVPNAPQAAHDEKGTESRLEANRSWCSVLASRNDPISKALAAANCRVSPSDSSSLSVVLNDIFRGIIQRTGKRCDAITDHVWVTPEHLSIMCDRRLRAAFIHDPDGWRLGRPGE